MFLAGILCLLSALTPISYSLMCTKCMSTNSTSCSGENVICNITEVCVSSYTQIMNNNGTTSSELIRSCAPSSQCNVTGLTRLPTAKIWKFTSCCDHDNCTSNVTGYSLMCTKCRSTNSTSCSGKNVTCNTTEVCVSSYTEIMNNNGTTSSELIRSCAPSSQCNVTGLTRLPTAKIWKFTSCCDDDNCTSNVTGYSLMCTECMSTNSTSCTGKNMTCNKNEVCASSYTQILNSDGTTSSELIRSCAPSSQCNVTGVISLPTAKIWKFTSCCDDDNCTSPIVTAPFFSSEANKVICPTCQASDSDWCYDGSTVPCFGDQNVCALYTTTRDGRKSSVRGCVSQSMCGSQIYNVNGSIIGYDGTCTCGGGPSSALCADTNVTCPAGTVCSTVYAFSTIGDASAKRITKKCSPINQCGISGIASIPKGNMKIRTVCYTDTCHLSSPALPTKKTNTNGVTCRSCISADTECYTSETVQCTGDERVCLLQSTVLTGRTNASTTMRSCTTKNICDLVSQNYTVDGITSAIKFTCTSGTVPVQRSLVTLSVISLFVLKYLM